MEHQPNWYRAQVVANVFVAVFAAATLWVGCQQYHILREANRPFIAAGFFPEGGGVPQTGKKLRYGLKLINSGKTAAMVRIRSVIAYSLKPEAPALPDVETPQLVWPGINTNEDVWGVEEMTEGQMKDMEAGRGYIAVRAVITYGKYHTNICTILETKKATDANAPAQGTGWYLCKEPGTNDVN